MSVKKKVMVVDDDEKLLEITKFILENEGYEVLVHNRAIGSTNHIKDFKPDIVLLDINMPALSGESLAKVISSTKSVQDTPIIFHSSNDEESLRDSVMENGAKGYICKGDLADLKRKVAYFLAESEIAAS